MSLAAHTKSAGFATLVTLSLHDSKHAKGLTMASLTLSFCSISDWNSLFPTASELVEYYRRFAEHFNLINSTTFHRDVISATWSEKDAVWRVEAIDNTTGATEIWTARVLVQAAGTYNRKAFPQIPGMDRFAGETWHASDWPESYDFTGKRVAYVGTGPTSIQVLPYIQAQAASLSVFCRSMTYCHPWFNVQYSDRTKWAFRRVPGLMSVYAWLIGNLFFIWAFFAFKPDSWVSSFTEWFCRRHLAGQVADPELLATLQPTGRFGSKRPLVTFGSFFDTLQKPNVVVTKNPIVEVDGTGIITHAPVTDDVCIQIDEPRTDDAGTDVGSIEKGRKHTEVDVIVWGTGFLMQGWGGAVPTKGRGGILLSDHWGGSPETLYGTVPNKYCVFNFILIFNNYYLGTMTANFPNLLLVNGPNTTTYWSSLIKGLELQARYNARVVRHVYEKSKSSTLYALEPTKEKQQQWTQSMQKALRKLASSPDYGPGFYYLNDKGQNTFFWPWTQGYYRWKTRQLALENYMETGC